MKHRQTPSRRVSVFLAVAFFAVGLLIVSFIIAVKVTAPKTEYAFRDGAEQEDFDDESFEREGKWYGLCAKNSIHSVDDFRTTVSKDQVLKTHYADFKWENAKVAKLEKTMLAYVYFRKDDKIFVKKKPIKLPGGDEYITDGNRRVRTHCCNNYTQGPPLFQPSGPPAELSAGIPAQNPGQTSPFSPSSVHVTPTPPLEDTPPINFISYSIGATTVVPEPYPPPPTPIIPGNGSGGGGGWPVIPGHGGGGGGGPTIPGNGGGGGGTKPVPEAATILLVGVGVAFSFIAFFIGNYYTHKRKTPRYRT